MKKVYSLMAVLLTIIGISVASSASFGVLYQPKTPRGLQK